MNRNLKEVREQEMWLVRGRGFKEREGLKGAAWCVGSCRRPPWLWPEWSK